MESAESSNNQVVRLTTDVIGQVSSLGEHGRTTHEAEMVEAWQHCVLDMHEAHHSMMRCVCRRCRIAAMGCEVVTATVEPLTESGSAAEVGVRCAKTVKTLDLQYFQTTSAGDRRMSDMSGSRPVDCAAWPHDSRAEGFAIGHHSENRSIGEPCARFDHCIFLEKTSSIAHA